MQQFTINTPDGEHLGFLMMLADDEQTHASGQLAIKLTTNVQDNRLTDWQNEGALFWAIDGDCVKVRDANDILRGTIRQQWLVIGSEHYLLENLTGVF